MAYLLWRTERSCSMLCQRAGPGDAMLTTNAYDSTTNFAAIGIRVYVYIHRYMYEIEKCMYACMYVCMYVCMFVYMYG